MRECKHCHGMGEVIQVLKRKTGDQIVNAVCKKCRGSGVA